MEDPTTQIPPEPRPTPPLRGSRDLFDINILPDRFRRRRLTLLVLLPWLVLAVLLGTLYPVYTLAIQTQSSFQEERLAFARVQAEFDFYQTSSQEQEALQTQIDEVQTQKDAIIQSYGGLQLSNIQWSPTLFQINQLLPAGVSWTQITQHERTIRLDGISSEYQQIIALLDSLISLDSLVDVEINSIEKNDLEDLPDLSEEDLLLSGGAGTTYYRFTMTAHTAGEVEP